jgi:DNA-binding NarL/FixJ family response regulator
MKMSHVVVADAHLNMLKGVHSLLESLFEAVLMVADEQSLIQAVAAFAPDLVIVDLSLPVTVGTNVARRLQDHGPAVPIVVLTVHDEPSIASQLLEMGLSGIVLKRTAATDLLPAIREVLRGGTYVSPALRLPPGEQGLNSRGGANEAKAEPP